jgi:DNA-binding transcriptional regulator LsrR (DeoR family)
MKKTWKVNEQEITFGELLEFVAYLHASLKWPQERIAEMFDVSQPTVSRWLKEAEDEHGLFSREVITTFCKPSRLDALEERLRALTLPAELLERFRPGGQVQGLLRRPRVFASKRGSATPDRSESEWLKQTWGKAALRFGGEAAEELSQLLSRSEVCGVAWGRHLFACLEGIARLDLKPLRGENRPLFFPVWGDPYGRFAEERDEDFPRPEKLDSTYLAMEMAERINGTSQNVPSLRGSAPLIPKGFKDNEVRVIKRFIMMNPAYVTIFGQQEARRGPRTRSKEKQEESQPLIARMDAFLAGVGSAKDPGRFLSNAVLGEAGYTEKELVEFAVGDLGGAVIPKDGNEAEERLEKFNEHWMGVKLEDVRNCAQRAAIAGTPGVIVVACGREKADIVAACVRANLINELFIDDDLAKALDEALPPSNR